ncbi:MAG: site-specific DNA-methyltransferase, partial [Bacteroidales bacterium]|nr:site-specific DNA-methyltransferase [Bacteroidales bacterium]
MPTLTWIGKDKVVNHHHDVPYRVLEHKYGFRAEDEGDRTPTDSGNKIIHGDNLEALKSLLPEYEGRVKCIYIDPPYNTGNEKWVYNDNVNDPKIQKWLGEVVGKQGEDLSRHDKWLCMMYPRLKLLQKLLAEDGAIFISIDDNEQANLRLLCDEIFGANQFIGQAIWYKKRKGSYLSKEFVSLTEYVVCYRKNEKLNLYGGKPNSGESQPLVKRTNSIGLLSFPANTVKTKLPDGLYPLGKYGKGSSSVELLTNIQIENGIVTNEFMLRGPFIWSQDFLDKEIKQGSELVINTTNLQPRAYRNSDDKYKGFPSFIDGREFSATNDDAYEDLLTIFNKEGIFNYSKPAEFISFCINSVSYFDRNAIILDSFAGSGTTAHAVLNLNKQDGGNRKFILVEMEDYAESITAERVRRVMRGYGEGKNATAGTGGAFDYYELGEPLFDKEGNLNENIAEERIRAYIYYTETRQHLVRKRSDKSKYLLDKCNETGYYFYYERNKLTTLSMDTLDIVTEQADQYVVYADVCTLPE